jgi:hypothetical protein
LLTNGVCPIGTAPNEDIVVLAATRDEAARTVPYDTAKTALAVFKTRRFRTDPTFAISHENDGDDGR